MRTDRSAAVHRTRLVFKTTLLVTLLATALDAKNSPTRRPGGDRRPLP